VVDSFYGRVLWFHSCRVFGSVIVEQRPL